jgi:3-dehydroquinate dehydratase
MMGIGWGPQLTSKGKKCHGLGTKPDVKEFFRRLRPRWEDNIKMSFKGTDLNVADWIHLAQDSVQRQVVLNIA